MKKLIWKLSIFITKKQEQYKKSLISYPEQTKVDISAHYSLRPI